jgi:7,8-dihydropterin-6-yl-methyl-4-(beta-D-ribofuranosyl)aminobenzene 5'-phosphate synthase
LFDVGVSPEGLLFNAKILGVNVADIDSIIISHGHADHYTGLMKVLQHISRQIPVYAHPDAFLRFTVRGVRSSTYKNISQ